MIVLDSNQLISAAPPNGPLLGLLRKLAQASEHLIAIPQMVLDEYLAHHEHAVQKAIGDIQKTARRLSRDFEQDIYGQIPRLNVADAVQIRRKAWRNSLPFCPRLREPSARH